MVKALIITGGGTPAKEFLDFYCPSPDLVIAADSGLKTAFEAGYTVDLAVGDMDSLDDLTLLDRLCGSCIERWPADKDYTDTELALAAGRRMGADTLVLAGGGGGRLDHTLALVQLFSGADGPDMWLTDCNLVLPLVAGFKPQVLDVHTNSLPCIVSFFSTHNTAVSAVSWGLRWPLDAVDWSITSCSLSNRSDDGAFTVRLESGKLLVVLSTESKAEFSLRPAQR